MTDVWGGVRVTVGLLSILFLCMWWYAPNLFTLSLYVLDVHVHV